jgi:hypothetical protein
MMLELIVVGVEELLTYISRKHKKPGDKDISSYPGFWCWPGGCGWTKLPLIGIASTPDFDDTPHPRYHVSVPCLGNDHNVTNSSFDSITLRPQITIVRFAISFMRRLIELATGCRFYRQLEVVEREYLVSCSTHHVKRDWTFPGTIAQIKCWGRLCP